MCFGDYPQALNAKKRILLAFLYVIFFVSSTIPCVHPLFYMSFGDLILTVAFGIGDSGESSIALVYLFNIIRFFSVPITIIYSIIEVCMLFCCKKINIGTTKLFRYLIAFQDSVSLILTIIMTVKYSEPTLTLTWFETNYFIVVWSLSYMVSLVTNCFLLFNISRFKQKGPYFSCAEFE